MMELPTIHLSGLLLNADKQDLIVNCSFRDISMAYELCARHGSSIGDVKVKTAVLMCVVFKNEEK